MEFDKIHRDRWILGVDEVGVGALAGPIVACATVLRPGVRIPGVRDSKKMTRDRRRRKIESITDHVSNWYCGWIGHEEADQGIHTARFKIMVVCAEVAYDMCKRDYGVEPLIVIDGDVLPKPLKRYKGAISLVKGDQKCMAVSAASVLAKVIRDDFMLRMSNMTPGYRWETNSGYPTRQHLEGLEKHGLSAIHRNTISKNALRRYRKKQNA